MSLAARVVVGRGDVRVDVELAVADGETLAVLGPNGAGKTTLLHAIAGLQPLEAGRIAVAGEVVDEPAAGIFLPPERRRIGLVFQESLLFPHLTALDNVAFGLAARGRSRREARCEAAAWLERVGVAALADRPARRLSGGEAQRVALARALAIEPRLLLLDEPLAALDVAGRRRFRRALHTDLRGYPGPRVVVTHDPVDAFALADRIAILEAGRLTHVGPPEAIRGRPTTDYAAEVFGLNLLRGRAEAGRIAIDGGPTLVVAEADLDGDAIVVLRPQAIALHRERPEGTPRNVWPAVIVAIEPRDERVRVQLDGMGGIEVEVTPAAVADLGLATGLSVWASVKATDIAVHPA